ncbi:MAG: hypothetical protein JWN30_497 [Bacilli bacterium]|nr:hypothetical protein [Bacilli bacterium]
MHYIYICRYCSTHMGEVDTTWINDSRLGLTSLTHQERADIISFDSINNCAQVNTICDYCQLALEQHPELGLEKSPLQ